jgi:endonuclease/exonuclease/phosphatase (EEP) superfamily protein YafD
LTDMRSRAETGAPAPDAAALKAAKVRRRGRAACAWVFLLGLVGLAAGRLGVLWIDFDVFAQFTLQFGIIALAGLIGFVMRRGRTLTTLVLIILGYFGIGLWPHIASYNVVSEPSGLTEKGRVLKILSFNSSLQNLDGEAVAKEVERHAPDIVVLIESGSEKRQVFERLRTSFPYQVNCLEIAYCDMAVLAKFPIAEHEGHVLWRGPPTIRAIFGPELNGLSVFGVHSTRFPHQRSQLIQMVELAKYVDRSPGEHIVMGDFNATPYSRQLQTFQRNSGLNRLTYLPTWSSKLVQLPQIDIDHIFVSASLEPLGRAFIGGSAGSDHYPVIATIRMRPLP